MLKAKTATNSRQKDRDPRVDCLLETVFQAQGRRNFKGRSEHFELRWRFLHHYILRGVVTIKAIKRDLQLADIGTAPRPHPQLHSMGRVVHGEC